MFQKSTTNKKTHKKTEHNHKTTQKNTDNKQTHIHAKTQQQNTRCFWNGCMCLVCVCVCVLFCGVFGSLFPTTLSITFSQSPYFNHFHFCQSTLSITFLNDVFLITFLNHFSESLFHSLLTKVNKLQIITHKTNATTSISQKHTQTHTHTHKKKQKQSTKNKNSFIPRKEHNKHQKQTHKKKNTRFSVWLFVVGLCCVSFCGCVRHLLCVCL